MNNPPIGPVLAHYGWDGRQWGRGEWVTIKCPFHGDKHASGRLNEDEGVFACMACDVRGNAYKVVEIHEGVGCDEAQRRVQGITGAGGGSVPGSLAPRRLASSKLPAWTRNQSVDSRRLASRGGRRQRP